MCAYIHICIPYYILESIDTHTHTHIYIYIYTHLLKTFMMKFWRKGGRKKYFKISDGLLHCYIKRTH